MRPQRRGRLRNGLDRQGLHAADTTNEACAFVASKCSTITPSLCAGIMDLATPIGQAAISGCMDPSNEDYYAPYTTGPNPDCDVNLQYCANLPVPAQRP